MDADVRFARHISQLLVRVHRLRIDLVFDYDGEANPEIGIAGVRPIALRLQLAGQGRDDPALRRRPHRPSLAGWGANQRIRAECAEIGGSVEIGRDLHARSARHR